MTTHTKSRSIPTTRSSSGVRWAKKNTSAKSTASSASPPEIKSSIKMAGNNHGVLPVPLESKRPKSSKTSKSTPKSKKSGNRERPSISKRYSSLSNHKGSERPPLASGTAAEMNKKYELLMGRRHELGRGSFSNVRSGVVRRNGQEVAVKMVKKKYLTDEEELQMVRREIEIQTVAQHPNIVHLHEVYEDDTYYYLILERSNHGNLLQLLANMPEQTEADCRAIFKQILMAVDFLHSRNVLHADIKPENVLLTVPAVVSSPHHHSSKASAISKGLRNIGAHLSKPRISSLTAAAKTEAGAVVAGPSEAADVIHADGGLVHDHPEGEWYSFDYSIPLSNVQVKLCDFGLSRALSSERNKRATGRADLIPYTQFRGTMGYVAPEILKAQACNEKADMWALGCILYEMLSNGTKPFVPYKDCLTVPVEFHEAVWGKRSNECRSVVQSLLNLDPAKRPSAQAVLETAWMTIDLL